MNYLRDRADDMGVKLIKLRGIYTIRFVSSSLHSVHVVRKQWYLLVRTLDAIANDNSKFNEETRLEAQNLSNTLKKQKFFIDSSFF